MKVATFTVHATAEQSRRWKIAAEAEGFQSAGAWLACAADAYLKARARAGLPVPLAWRRATFRVDLESGEATVRGHASPPFGVFYGSPAGVPTYLGGKRQSLVYMPSKRILATLRTLAEAKVLAAELARLWYRGEGAEPSGNPAPVLSTSTVRY